ncbi:SAM-dependent methyltransferase [Marixanthomonas spongiae]|uniref:SAM-dependent methyltransferase n=1 Tax=Marixanthomonas spongiae TaxID=2174845 RepID=A0A2U0HWH6_9FLAO|nr:SAM-dependent methyltransferase [Marixanthomonas spongiae]
MLHPEVQVFIKNYTEDITKLAFSGSPFKNISVQELIQQIESRRKAEKKLPTWYKTKGVYYPNKINLEQTSSEITAQYKASLIEGKTLADITGGFGVDSYFFSKQMEQVTHFEFDRTLSEIAAHNFKQLNVSNVSCKATDGLEAVKNKRYDIIFADPSRRHETKGKVFFLNDCEPNIPKHLSTLLDQCELLMVKTSPMLDISVGMEELKHVFQIHIVAVNNEVKELLWLLKKAYNDETEIITKNIKKDKTEAYSIVYNEMAEAFYDSPKRFLYEPNAAILKSGAFETVSEGFKLKKLHKNTHLYTSEALRGFPGRRFLIEKVLPYSKKELKKAGIAKANITIRNFPATVAALRKKHNIKDGGEIYLFFTTINPNKKVVLVCSKVSDIR